MTDTANAPERIWAFHAGPMVGLFIGKKEVGTNVSEYILATHCDELVAAARAEGARDAQAKIARLTEALKEIAHQKKTSELDTEYDVECADFEAGYDACIDRARAALQENANE